MSAGGVGEDSTTSSEPTTSREVQENVYHLHPQQHENSNNKQDEEPSISISSPTASEPSESRSTADIPSEVLISLGGDEPTGGGAAAAAVDTTERAGPVESQIDGHLLPDGWACNHYGLMTDQYCFEYGPRLDSVEGTGDVRAASAQRQTQDRAISVKTPTRDETVQTSRRPTLLQLQCQYGYHFPTSPTSSMISELARQVQKQSSTGGPGAPAGAPKSRQVGYGKHKLTLPADEEEQTRRLRDMFPTATVPVIEQMIRIYHGREGLIKAGLISLGYKRASEYGAQQAAAAQSPIMLMMSKPSSKKLFDKLVSYFPDKDEAQIKSLMYKHKEAEHEIISALVECSQADAHGAQSQSQLESALKLDRSGAIMKLRYLKFLYPTCEEIELYHLLNCNDLNAQRVMEIVESRGHKRANIDEVLQNRKSQTQQMRAQQTAHAAKEKACSNASELVQAHVGRTRPTVVESRVNNLKSSLLKTFENLDERLALGALQATDYNEPLARKFLEERQPVDESLYKQRYETHLEAPPNTVAFPCKAIQKDDTNFMSIMANESVQIAREVVECEHALALLKVDASTFTNDDFPQERRSRAQGAQMNLHTGPSVARQREMKLRDSAQVGPNGKLRRGTKYDEISQDEKRAKPGTQARGCKERLAKGHQSVLRCGHNAKLLERVHPFFREHNQRLEGR